MPRVNVMSAIKHKGRIYHQGETVNLPQEIIDELPEGRVELAGKKPEETKEPAGEKK